MKIIIHAWSRPLRNGKENPKNYPYWEALIEQLQRDRHELIQIGLEDEKRLVADFRAGLSFKELKTLARECDTWISVDSFFQHLAWRIGKKGIVLFGQSDPRIFGHSENYNLYAGQRFFRTNQFNTWEECEYKEEAFVSPNDVINIINTYKHITSTVIYESRDRQT